MPYIIAGEIGALLFAAGVDLLVVNAITAAAVVGAQIAIQIGLQLAVSALTQGQSPLPKPSDGQQEIRQPLSPRVKNYGTVRISGTVWWFAAEGRVLYLGLALNHGRVGRFVTYHIDENQVDLDGTDLVTTAPYNTGGEVFIHSRLGLTPETKYDDILDVFGVDEARGDGAATLLATFENPTDAAQFQNTYPNGRPQVRVTIDASVVWDPREDVSLGGTQDRDDPDTWEFSDNPIVCLLDYLTSADGYGIPYSKVEPNLDQWIEAMDVCDEEIDLLAGGTTRRYRIAGSYRLNDAPRDVLAKFMTCCDGRVWAKRDGTIGVVAGKFVEPTVTLTAAHITGWNELTRGQDPIRSVVGIRAEYTSPEHDYREHEAEPWPTGAEVSALDEDRVASLDLLWSPSNSQTRRLMKRHYERVTAEWRGTIFTNAYGLKALDERFVRLTIPELDLDATFEIVSFAFDPNAALACTLEIISVDATIDDWDPSEEGTEEATALAFTGNFEKASATTIDPIGEAGAEVGEYVLIAHVYASAAAFPAVPAGYQNIGSLNDGGGLSMRVLGRKIDGTETTITVNSASGSILVNRFRGVTDPQFADVIAHAEATNGFNNDIPAQPTPMMIFAFASTNESAFDEADFLQLIQITGKIAIEEHSFRIFATTPVAHVEFAIFGTGESIDPSGFRAHMASDRGSVQGMVSFSLLPG